MGNGKLIGMKSELGHHMHMLLRTEIILMLNKGTVDKL